MLSSRKMLLVSVLCIVLFPFFCSGDILDQSIEFDVQNQTFGKARYEIFNLPKLDYIVNVINIPKEVEFFIIQVHTLKENVTLEDSSTKSRISGTNIGLVKLIGAPTDSFLLFRHQDLINQELQIMVAVSMYTKNDPIPGGCNVLFETQFAPYQKVNYTDEIITVQSQPPSYMAPLCNDTGIFTDMYFMYLKESKNYDEYFAGIQKMLNADDIEMYGTRIPTGLTSNKFDLMYNNYKGIGRVFAIIARSDRGISAYIPAATFGCRIDSNESCAGLDGVHWSVFVATLPFLGAFLCLYGHRCFKITMFVNTTILVAFGFFIITTFDEEFISEGKAIFSLLMGGVIGGLWVFCWWWLGIPVLAVLSTFILTGILIASVLFYIPCGNIYVLFTGKFSFWAIFWAVVVICQLPLLCLKPLSHMVAISFLASYAIVIALNYYIDGNLYYIIINIYRRISVIKFENVVIDPPFQFANTFSSFLWIVSCIAGIYFQFQKSRGRPPFPPHRRSLEVPCNDERSPLLNIEIIFPGNRQFSPQRRRYEEIRD